MKPAANYKRFIALFLVCVTLATSLSTGTQTVAAGGQASGFVIYTSASSWAQPEIEKAYNDGLLPASLLPLRAPDPATRENLCETIVLLYEKTTGKTVTPASNPFSDTTNIAVLKAFALGITTGTTPTTFSPNDLTNREQAATMFGRAIRVMFPNGDYSTAGATAFNDQSLISSWALDNVLYMSKNGIINGANGNFMPRATTADQIAGKYGMMTREQAIAISVRVYDKYSGSATLEEKFANSLIRTNIPSVSELDKLKALTYDNAVFRPVYHPAITLAGTGGVDSGASSRAPWTCIVTPDGSQTKTFSFSLRSATAAQASKIIWQVSLVPFSGGPVNPSDKQGGLLLSGELAKGSSSFTVDFSKVYSAEQTLRHPIFSPVIITVPGNLHLPTLPATAVTGVMAALGQEKSLPLRTYYVRAFPVNSTGSSIGDGGTGLPVLYGDPVPLHSGTALPNPLTNNFSLKPAMSSGQVTYNGEFPNKFIDVSGRTLTTTDNKSYAFLPSGFLVATQKLLLQVSLQNYSASAADWTSTPGLVYQMSFSADDPVFKALGNFNTPGIAIDFSKFVPSDSALPSNQYIPYYIRAVALTEGKQAGTASASYSETITVDYGINQSPAIKIYSQVGIKPEIPTVEKMTYTPIQWESYNWQYHYVVTRQPTMKDVFGPLFGNTFGSIINSNDPYTAYPVGTKLDFTPQPEDKSWWEEAWDAITSFFSDLVGFLANIVNWVSKAYASLKSGLINIVVSALPSSLQGPLRTCLTGLVDYGLMSIGIPPTLPNFDELAGMGTDYLASMAMEQAGVPAGSLITDGVKELAGDIKTELTKSTGSGSPNPMNWDFIKLDPDDVFRPAYITVDLYNPYNEPTPQGWLSFTADTSMDLSKNGSDTAVTRLYAAYGSPWVTLYKPVYGMAIPSLAPGQHLSVPVVLENYVNVPFPGCTAPVNPGDFMLMYAGLGKYNFSLSISYDLPSVTDEAKKQGYTGDAIYSYTATGNSIQFSINPTDGYSK